MNRNLDSAAKILKKGGIVIFPTDTAFGIGCRLDDDKAVRKLFDIRKRQADKAILMLAASDQMAFEYVKRVNKKTRELAEKYWPGGLTIIFEADEPHVPKIVRGGGKTIGIRVPAHQTVRKLIKKVGIPILAPSANFAGDATPYRMSEINPMLIKLVDFVMPGRCKIREQSTVVDATGSKLKILRKGAVEL